MSKRSGITRVTPGSVDLDQVVIPDVGGGVEVEQEVQEAAPAEDPRGYQGFEALLQEPDPIQQEIQDEVAFAADTRLDANLERSMDLEAQREAEAIPTLQQRLKGERQGLGRYDTGVSEMPKKKAFEQTTFSNETIADDMSKDTVFGGVLSRANRMNQMVASGDLESKLAVTGKSLTGEQRSLGQLLDRMGVMNSEVVESSGVNEKTGEAWSARKLVPTGLDNNFINATSLIAETVLSGKRAEQQFNETTGTWEDKPLTEREVEEGPQKRSQDSARVGKMIWNDTWRRKNAEAGRPTDVIPPIEKEDAIMLGDWGKEMWVRANPDYVTRYAPGDAFLPPELQGTREVVYQLTPVGAAALGTTAAKKVHERAGVKFDARPLKTEPSRKGYVGEGQKHTKKQSGAITGKKVNNAVIDESMYNQSQVAQVVHVPAKTAYYAMLLPALASTSLQNFGGNEVQTAMADIFGFGPKLHKTIEAEANMRSRKDEMDNMTDQERASKIDSIKANVAQGVQFVADVGTSPFWLTYYQQTFQGRQATQQNTSYMSDKGVRAVTKGIQEMQLVGDGGTKDNRIDRNFRRIVAANTIKEAKEAIPEERDRLLDNYSPQIVAEGKRIKQLLDGAIDRQTMDAIDQAVLAGIPMNDERFPDISNVGLKFDFENSPIDQQIFDKIKDFGEDAITYMTTAMDYARYKDWVDNGKQGAFRARVSTWIDGKTNGIAARGILIGSRDVAMRTGVLRPDDAKQILGDEDIRIELSQVLTDRVINEGFKLEASTDPAHQSAMQTIGKAVYGIKDLNKSSTMQFGYGLDMSGFGTLLEAELYNQMETVPEVAAAVAVLENVGIPIRAYNESILGHLSRMYIEGVTSVMSGKAIQARQVERSIALAFTLADSTFSYDGPLGKHQQLHFGGQQRKVADDKKVSYEIQGERQQPTVYGSRETAAAMRMDSKTGGYGAGAIGGVAPGTIQSTDAATVSLSFSGKSWNKMTSASNGVPYMRQVFDAFELDAYGFDVGLEEINNNWLDLLEQYDPFNAMADSYEKKAKSAIEAKMKELDELIEAGQTIDTTDPDSGFVMFSEFFTDYGSPLAMFPQYKIGKILMQSMAWKDGESYNGFSWRIKGKKNDKNVLRQFLAILDKHMPGWATAEDRVNAAGGRVPTSLEKADPKAVKEVYQLLLHLTDPHKRMRDFAKEANADKKKLIQEIRASGLPNYQYYGH